MAEAKFYLHNISWPIFGLLGLAEAGVLFLIWYQGVTIPTGLAAVIIAFILLNFVSRTIVVFPEYIMISYGIGLVRSFIDIHTMADFRVVPNSSFLSLYNLSAENVLEVRDRFGRKVVIGGGDPKALAEYLRTRARG